MLTRLGRGPSPMASIPFAKRFYLTSALPPEITFTRASAATYMNSDARLVSAITNQARFDHTRSGDKLGLLLEGAITNKCTNHNATPTTTTGFTTSGDNAGVLSVVDDASALYAAGLHLVCTSGAVYCADNSAGSAAFTVSFPGTTGNTNKHSASMYTRSPDEGTVATLGLNGSPANIAASSLYTRFRLENQTPDSSSRTITLTVAAGKTVYFILNQLEESAFSSSVIVTAGSSASRAADRAFIDSIHTRPWYSAAAGYIACRYFLPRLNTADSYIAVLHDNSANNTMGLRLSSSDHDVLAYVRSGGSNLFTLSNDDHHVPGALHAAGISWTNDECLILSGAMPKTGSLASFPPNLSRLEIGARNGGVAPIQGHMQMIEVGHGYLDPAALGAKLTLQTDIALACAGQSLMQGHFQSQDSSSEAGKQTHRSAIGTVFPERVVSLANATAGASAASKTSNDTQYWWDTDTDSPGPALDNFFAQISTQGMKPTGILWAQGEADSHYIGDVTPRALYKDALEKIFATMRMRHGPVPVFIQRIGRRTSFANTGGIQAVRDVQQELIDTYPWCHAAGEIYDLDLYDGLHLSDAAYIQAARRNAAAIGHSIDPARTALRGPVIVSASRTEDTVTVTLTHEGGTDITPSSGIDGFVFMDGASSIAITAAVRTDANTVTLTLDSTPTSGTETLYYGYDAMLSVETANILRDNGPLNTSLRTTKIIL